MDTERIRTITTHAQAWDGTSLISLPTPPADYLRTHVDIGLGEALTDVSVDDTLVLERMRQEGLSKEDIAALTLHISADAPVDNDVYTYGYYVRQGAPSITLYPCSVIMDWKRQAGEMIQDRSKNNTHCYVEETTSKASRYVSNTLYHEIRHARQDLAEGILEGINISHDRRLRTYRRVGASAGLLMSTLGSIELAMLSSTGSAFAVPAMMAGVIATAHAAEKYRTTTEYTDYRNNLAEIDARSAEDDIAVPIVHLVPKAEVTSWTAEDFTEVAPAPKLTMRRHVRMLALRTAVAIENIFE